MVRRLLAAASDPLPLSRPVLVLPAALLSEAPFLLLAPLPLLLFGLPSWFKCLDRAKCGLDWTPLKAEEVYTEYALGLTTVTRRITGKLNTQSA